MLFIESLSPLCRPRKVLKRFALISLDSQPLKVAVSQVIHSHTRTALACTSVAFDCSLKANLINANTEVMAPANEVDGGHIPFITAQHVCCLLADREAAPTVKLVCRGHRRSKYGSSLNHDFRALDPFWKLRPQRKLKPLRRGSAHLRREVTWWLRSQASWLKWGVRLVASTRMGLRPPENACRRDLGQLSIVASSPPCSKDAPERKLGVNLT